ncbi:outer membrane beta-barrel protein [Ketobacter alkanivorans]|uniref:Outer membrane protein beta-barrel domain-containing protein n=1 Tax=Ketobacter alkanivorans TaxID=1917421 RepID=A0A2K9LL41_9GAMM|nr:outer membrane beta-barrel protein [Ketobacter alkanivorans]AUM12980.1 hypothetical protein Kalk_11335 [Ketobacter alkanivorans]
MKKLVSTFLLSSVAATSALANQGYVGVELGKVQAEVTADYLSENLDFEPTAFKVKGGSELNENLAIEGYLGFGLSDDTVEYTYIDAEVNTMVGIGVRGILPLGDAFSVNGKVGLANISYEDSEGDKYKNTGLEYGVGLKINLGTSSAITLDYTFLPDAENDEWDLDIEAEMLSIGFQFYPQ